MYKYVGVSALKGTKYVNSIFCIWFCVRDAVKNYLADFFRQGGTPPPFTPLLAENHFAKKPLAEMGGTPPPSP